MLNTLRYLAITKGYVADNAYVVKTPFTTHGSLYTNKGAIYCNNTAEISERLEKICLLSNGVNTNAYNAGKLFNYILNSFSRSIN